MNRFSDNLIPKNRTVLTLNSLDFMRSANDIEDNVKRAYARLKLRHQRTGEPFEVKYLTREEDNRYQEHTLRFDFRDDKRNMERMSVATQKNNFYAFHESEKGKAVFEENLRIVLEIDKHAKYNTPKKTWDPIGKLSHQVNW